MDACASQPVLIAVGGGVASGKSTLASGLADALAARLLVADRTRGELMRARAAEGDEVALRSFSTAAADEVYEEMIGRAEPVLRAGDHVVLDGCFATRRQRDLARSVAERVGARFHLLLCHASRAVVEARLEARALRDSLPRDSWLRLFQALEARREAPHELSADLYNEVPTDVGASESLALALGTLERWGVARAHSRAPAA